MGTSHLSPNGTKRRAQNLIDYRGNHVDLEHLEDELLARRTFERQEQRVIERMEEEFSFEELSEHRWINDNQKVIAETRHGVELRELIHPSGTTAYFYICVVADNWEETNNIGMTHLETYHEELKQVLADVFGTVRRKKTAWTSEEVEV